eukprot:TRINITY_DN4647_c2_g1_i1.p1 TRINITY_DN4647_c2_g1~~TRINITY_DN4647_c2_g1_i1.p1  ORF type:complete len:1790 (-),score=358.53 TRINITY_DN4647_c2_g1_i1:120-5489(-)
MAMRKLLSVQDGRGIAGHDGHDKAAEQRKWVESFAGRRLLAPSRGRKMPSVAKWLCERASAGHEQQWSERQVLLPRLSAPPIEQVATGIMPPQTPSSSSRGPIAADKLPSSDRHAVNLLGAATGAKWRQIKRTPLHRAIPFDKDSEEEDQEMSLEVVEAAARQALARELPKDSALVRTWSNSGTSGDKGHANLFEQFANGAIIGPGSIFSHAKVAPGVLAPGLQPAPPPPLPLPKKRREILAATAQRRSVIRQSPQADASADAPDCELASSDVFDAINLEVGSSEPAILPREPARPQMQPGSVATMHASRVEGSRLVSACEESRRNWSPRSTMRSTWSNWSTSRRVVSDNLADRKWHLRQAPLSTSLARSANSSNRLPAASAFPQSPKARSGSPEYLSFQGWGIDDDYYSGLFSRVKLSKLRHVNLSDNRLTEASVRHLVEMARHEPLEALESLHLGQNRLGPLGGQALVQLLRVPPRSKSVPKFRLRELDLTDNNIGDQAGADLCDILQMTCKDIVGLCLARNRLGLGEGKTGPALCTLMGEARQLQSLDIHWNQFSGPGAASLCQGLQDNFSQMNGQLKRVNMAWNRLGLRCNNPEMLGEECACETCRGCAQAMATLAAVFAEGNVLFHLDLSYNGLSAKDCAVLGVGLQSNHSLFGLHLVGNEATIDDIGAVHPRTAPEEGLDGAALQSVTRQEALRRDLDDCVRNTPRKLQLDNLGRLVAKHPESGSLLDEAEELRKAYDRANPSLRRVESEDVFSVDDLRMEKDWVDTHAQVQLPASFGMRAQFEDVRLNERCCWICENWVEEQIYYVPGWSGSETSPWDVTQVYVYFSVDGFSRPTLLTKCTEKFYTRDFNLDRPGGPFDQYGIKHVASTDSFRENSDTSTKRLRSPFVDDDGRLLIFKGARMLPPSRVRTHVVFQVNDTFCVADHLKKVRLAQPVMLVPHCDGRSSEGTPLPAMAVAVEGSPSTSMVEVNEINVGSDAMKNYEQGNDNALCFREDPRRRGDLQVVPRALQRDPLAAAREGWTFEKSVFKLYTRDSKQLVAECFQKDHAFTRLPRLWQQLAKESSTSPHAVKQCLGKIYQQFMAAYDGESVKDFDHIRSSYGLSLKGFLRLMQERTDAKDIRSAPMLRSQKTRTTLKRQQTQTIARKKTELDLDRQRERGPIFTAAFPASVAEKCYMAASALDQDSAALKDFQGLPQQGLGLARFQFLEAVALTALARFYESKELHLLGALQKLVEELSLGKNVLYFRTTLHQVVFCEDCDLIFRRCRTLLSEAFSIYSKRSRLPGFDNNQLSYAAWIEFMQACKSPKATEQVQRLAFVIGKEICTDQHKTLQHMVLNWTEFLVCIAGAVHLSDALRPSEFAEQLLAFLQDHVTQAVQASRDDKKSKASGLVMAAVKKHGMDPQIQKIVSIFAEAFETSDEDASGALSTEEFSAMLSNQTVLMAVSDLGLSVKDMKLLFHRIDVDKSGTVSLQELVDGVLKFKIAMTGHEPAVLFLRRIFFQIDTGHAGKVSRPQFMDFVKSPKIVERLVKSGIKERDLDDLWSAAKQVVGEDHTSIYVTEEALVAGLLDLSQEKGNMIRGLNFMNQVFLVADVDGSGALTKREVENILNRQEVHEKLKSLHLAVPNWIDLYDELDVDGDGELNWNELRTAMLRIWNQAKTVRSEDEDDDDADDEEEKQEEDDEEEAAMHENHEEDDEEEEKDEEEEEEGEDEGDYCDNDEEHYNETDEKHYNETEKHEEERHEEGGDMDEEQDDQEKEESSAVNEDLGAALQRPDDGEEDPC